MKKLVILALLAGTLSLPVSGVAKDDFTLSLTLTIGERSRDSNAETTLIRLVGNSLTYEQTYSGYQGGKREPVRKEFKLKAGEIERLKSLVKEKNLLGSGVLKFEPSAGQHNYFEMNVSVTLKGIISTQELSGPRAAASIKDERVYQKAIALLQELYRLISLRDPQISYRAPVN
jgi:hypothetical protein